MTNEELQAIRDRVAKASPGPWTTEPGAYSGANWSLGYSSDYDKDVTVYLTTDGVHASEMYGDAATDGEFIAHARTDIPALLKAIDARDAELAQLRAELARLKPLAEAAVAWMASNSDESVDASTRLKLAAAGYARAQAQAGEGA